LIISIFEKNNISLIAFVILIIGFIFSRQYLIPIINKAKDDNNEKKFKALHQFSVLINFIQMGLCVLILVNVLK
jgi:hypothetical protein